MGMRLGVRLRQRRILLLSPIARRRGRCAGTHAGSGRGRKGKNRAPASHVGASDQRGPSRRGRDQRAHRRGPHRGSPAQSLPCRLPRLEQQQVGDTDKADRRICLASNSISRNTSPSAGRSRCPTGIEASGWTSRLPVGACNRPCCCSPISYANQGAVLMVDEPDAHLEILRQRQTYQLLVDAARENGNQIIVASHSAVLLNEAAGKDVVVAFVGKPHRIDGRASQVHKALEEIGYEDYCIWPNKPDGSCTWKAPPTWPFCALSPRIWNSRKPRKLWSVHSSSMSGTSTKMRAQPFLRVAGSAAFCFAERLSSTGWNPAHGSRSARTPS